MEIWVEATVERRPGGDLYLARENKGVDSTAALIKSLLETLPDRAKKVRIIVKVIDG